MCGWGPSDCQYSEVSGSRSCSTPQPGLAVETVQEARLPISLRCSVEEEVDMDGEGDGCEMDGGREAISSSSDTDA